MIKKQFNIKTVVTENAIIQQYSVNQTSGYLLKNKMIL